MTKSKSTKRALLSSVLALVLTCTMLLGTTFAWFTDSVKSGANKIVAGNLDVELEYTTDFTTWTSVEGKDALFKTDTLWEPGHAEVVYLRVRNAGTLALKYKFAMNITKDTTATNVAGEEFKLSQYLKYGVVADQQDAFADRAAAIAAVTNPTALSGYSKEDNLLPNASDYVALVVYMPETVGNEANYRGETIPEIELGVNLVATQDTVEADSWDNQYDANAQYKYDSYDVGVTYPFTINGATVNLQKQENGIFKNVDDTTDKTNYLADEAGFKSFVELSQNNDPSIMNNDLVLADDIDMGGEAMTPIGANTSTVYSFSGNVDGAGHTISNVNLGTGRAYGNGLFSAIAGSSVKNLTVKGLDIGYVPGNWGNIIGGITGYVWSSTTFENVHIVDCTLRGFGKVGGIVGMIGDPAFTVTFKNCSVENTTISATYDCAGLLGLSLGTTVVDDTNTVDVTWQRDSSQEYVELDTTIACSEGAAASCPGPLTPVKGIYWNDGSYYWGGFAKYYIQYGKSSHDCILTDVTSETGLELANSELCINTLD